MDQVRRGLSVAIVSLVVGVGTPATAAVPQPSQGAVVSAEACTRQAPCTGQRGGKYYTNAQGKKVYIRKK